MQPRLQATLADFVPALRFVAPERINGHLGHPDLPAAWWLGTPAEQALVVFGRADLSERLSELAFEELQHVALGDLLPAAWVARRDFRLFRWPSGARTNVLVHTPDWGDLLTSTVEDVSGWTGTGQVTVRSIVAQLFSEVFSLLPGQTPDEHPEPDDADTDADTDAETEDEDAPTVHDASGFTPVAPAASAGIRLQRDDSIHPAALSEDTGFQLPAVQAPEVLETEDEDEDPDHSDEFALTTAELEARLQPINAPVPPTGELVRVVRWLAVEAPDVPLMSELARITLETVSVVGIEEADADIRAAVVYLSTLVPGGLLPAGLELPSGEDVVRDDSRDGSRAASLAAEPAPFVLEKTGTVRPDLPAKPSAAPPPPAPDFLAASNDVTTVIDAPDLAKRRPPVEPAPTDEAPTGDFAALIGSWFAGQDPRWATVARERLFTDAPRDPGTLAGSLGADRIETDALERGLLDHIEDRLAEPSGTLLREHLAYLRDRLGGLATVAELRELDDRHEDTVTGADGTPVAHVWQVLRHLLRLHTSADGWLSQSPTGDLARQTANLLDDRCGTGPVALADLSGDLLDLGIRPELHESWIGRLDGFQINDGEVSVWATGSIWTPRPAHKPQLPSPLAETAAEPAYPVAESAAEPVAEPETAEVAHAGPPETSADLPAGSIPLGRAAAPKAAAPAAAPDDGNPFPPVVPAGVMLPPKPPAAPPAKAPRAGADAATMLAPQARQTPSGPPEMTSADLPAFTPPAAAAASQEDDTAPRSAAPAPPDGEVRCFRDEQGSWWHRVDVTPALLGGDQFPLPAGFTAGLGLKEGEQLRLHNAYGPAVLRHDAGGHPYCVSLKTVLDGLGAADGDMVFLTSLRPGRLEVRRLSGDGTVKLPRWAHALRRTGVDPVPDQVNLPELLGARIGLPSGSDLKSVLHKLTQRGDTDILNLLGVQSGK
jgi:hypothetical protein